MNKLPNVSPELVQKYNQEISKVSSSSSVKRKQASLNQFFNWAVDKGVADQNPLNKPGDTAIVTNPKTKSPFRLANFVRLSILVCLIILIFLFSRKLQFPINFDRIFGSENTPSSNIQVNEKITNVDLPEASPSAEPDSIISVGPAGNGYWNLYAKLKEIASQSITFKLYDSETSATPVWTSDPVTPTQLGTGYSLISLDNVPQDEFFQNNELYLGYDGASSRIPVSTANNPVVDTGQNITLTDDSPFVKALFNNLLIQGEDGVTLKTADGSDGSIQINPDGSGTADFIFEGSDGNYLNAQASNLTSGSLFYGSVANNALGTGYDLLRLESGTTPATRFSVDGSGNVYASGNQAIDGTLTTNGITNNGYYTQTSGNFSVTQGEGDTASIIKKGTALSDVLTLTLDERGKPETSNSSYSTLTLNRYDGSAEAAALHVDNGNAIFDGQLQLGRYTSNPDAIGQGSLVFNTSDSTVYVWDGSSWTAVGSGSGGDWTLAGDSGGGQTISSGDTASIVGGTNGIDTVDSATDTLTINLDTTEIGTTTFGSGSGITWTFDASAGTDPSLTFANDAITLTAATTTFSGDITVSGGNIDTGNIALTIGDGTTDSITLSTDGTGNGEIVLPNDSIGPDEILSTGQTDEYCLTYEATGTTLEWQTCSGGSFTSFTAAGDTGGGQTISDGDTLSIVGGTNGIDTVDSATDTVTINLDTTEIGTTTFGSGSGITWTFDASSGTDPAFTFSDGTITLAATTTALSGNLEIGGLTGLTFTGSGGEIAFTNGETIDNDTDGTVLITAPTTSLSGNLEVAGLTGLTFTGVGGQITFTNGETIDNDIDGDILITSPTTTLTGDLEIQTGNWIGLAASAGR